MKSKSLFAHAQKIYHEVRSELYLGAGNLIDVDPKVNQTILFYHLILQHLKTELVKQKLVKTSDFLTSTISPIHLSQMLLANLVMAFNAGNCTEQSTLAAFKLIESHYPGSIEVINMKGENTDKRIQDKKGVRYGFRNHQLLLLNSPADRKFDSPSTWKNVFILDTWWHGKLRKYNETETPTPLELSEGFFTPTTYTSIMRVDTPWSTKEWQLSAEFLKPCVEVLKNNFHFWAMDAKRDIGNVDHELKKIVTVFESKIQLYEKLAVESKIVKVKSEEKVLANPSQFFKPEPSKPTTVLNNNSMRQLLMLALLTLLPLIPLVLQISKFISTQFSSENNFISMMKPPMMP